MLYTAYNIPRQCLLPFHSSPQTFSRRSNTGGDRKAHITTHKVTLARRKFDPIPRPSLSADVVERLTEEILNGAFARLGTASTRRNRLGISNQSHRARGAVVSALSPDEVMQLFEARAVMECRMLRCALRI